MSLAEVLPHVNATLNATSGVLLVSGVWAIAARKDRELHKKLMAAALVVSAVFLISYLTRMSLTGPTKFGGTGWLKTTYLLILGTHSILAALVAPLAIRLVYLAAKDRLEEHKRMARWVFPVWLYVSVTGVLVYWMLYRLKV